MIETRMPVEALLERHLGPVTAPRELWDRVRNPPAARPAQKQVIRKLAWTFAALLAFAGVTSGLRAPISSAANEKAALQALARGNGELEFRSAKAAEIRGWIRAGTGMDVPLAENSQVRLLGAHVVAAGIVEIAYEVGSNGGAALVVSKAGWSLSSKDRHGELGREPYQSRKTLSWTRGAQQYTLACSIPGELQAACSLCHVDSQGKTEIN